MYLAVVMFVAVVTRAGVRRRPVRRRQHGPVGAMLTMCLAMERGGR